MLTLLNSPRIERKPLRDIVYDRLVQLINSGQLAAGEELREHAIATWFDVSRPPVREAMARLEANGLINTRFGATATVSQINNHDEAMRERMLMGLIAVAIESIHFPLSSTQLATLESSAEAARNAERASNYDSAVPELAQFDQTLIAFANSAPLTHAYREAIQPHQQRLPLCRRPRGIGYVIDMVEAITSGDRDTVTTLIEHFRDKATITLRNAEKVS